MSTIKTPKEIEILREGGKVLAQIIEEVSSMVKPGVSTFDLNKRADDLIKKAGGRASFRNYKPKGNKTSYPASLCVSINDEVVHAIPSKNKTLYDGDIVGIDLGMEYKGLYTDMAVTLPVGEISDEAKKLIDTTKKSLELGIKAIKNGGFIGDIGFAVQQYAEGQDFSVVRDLVGHGVGHKVHEEPMVPNYGKRGTGEKLKTGMVLALEPMINIGTFNVTVDDDTWTIRTADNSLSAHFEHTVVVTDKGVEVLTKI